MFSGISSRREKDFREVTRYLFGAGMYQFSLRCYLISGGECNSVNLPNEELGGGGGGIGNWEEEGEEKEDFDKIIMLQYLRIVVHIHLVFVSRYWMIATCFQDALDIVKE